MGFHWQNEQTNIDMISSRLGARRLAFLLLILFVLLSMMGTAIKAEDQRQEVVEKRSQYTKAYNNGDGTETLEIFGESVNYQDENGQWQPIDTNITAVPSINKNFFSLAVASPSEFDYVAKENRFQIFFGQTAAKPIRFQSEDKWVQFQALEGNTFQVEVNGNTAIYRNVWEQADLVYSVLADGLKEEIVLRDKTAPTTFTFQVEMQGVRAQIEDDGSIGFYDEQNGEKIWIMPSAFAYDSYASEESPSAPVATEMQTVGNNTYLKLTLDQAWLNDPSRVYPVVIDPTVKATDLSGYKRVSFTPNFTQTVQYSWDLEMPSDSWIRYNDSYFKIWTNTEQIAYRHVWFGKDIDSSSFTAEANKTYYAETRPGDGTWGLWNSFTGIAKLSITYQVDTPPSPPAQLDPAHTADDGQFTNKMIFKWLYTDLDKDPQARFNLQVDKLQTFDSQDKVPFWNYEGSLTSENGQEAVYETDLDLPDGTWYWRVKASDGYFWSSWSETKMVRVDRTPPSTPVQQEIMCLPEKGQITVQWTPSVDNFSGIKHYELEWNNNGVWERVAEPIMPPTQPLSVSLSNLSDNQLVDFRLRAVDMAENVSPWVEFQGASASVGTSIVAAVPGGTLKAGYSTALQFAPVAATKYQIKRTASDGVVSYSPWLTQPSYLDTGLKAHETYTYAVRTANPLDQPGEFSPEVKVSIPNNPPNVVNGLIPVDQDYTSQSQIELQAGIPAQDLDGDQIYVQFRLGASPDLATPIWSSEWLVADAENPPAATVKDLKEGTYYWGVWTKDGYDVKGPGRVQSFTVDYTIPQWVTIPGAEITTNNGALSFTWQSAVNGTAHFALVEAASGQIIKTEAVACLQGGNTYSVTLPVEGVYALSIYVTNDAGRRSMSAAQRLRYNKRPEAEIQSLAPVRKGESAALTAVLKDYDGTIVGYEWDFGDGTPVEKGGAASGSIEAKHTYTQIGTFTVTLTLVDDNGREGTAQGTVTVTNTHEGPLLLDEEWSGTWEVTGDVIVPAGRTLTVREGSVILVAPGKTLKVEGKLVVQGTANLPVRFQGAQSPSDPMTLDESARWQGILIYTASPEQSTLQHAEITGAIRGVAVIRGGAALDNVNFNGNIVGLHVYAASPEITNCRFTQNALYGIKEDAGAAPVVKGCEFGGNGVGGYYDEIETIITIERLNEMAPNSDNR